MLERRSDPRGPDTASAGAFLEAAKDQRAAGDLEVALRLARRAVEVAATEGNQSLEAEASGFASGLLANDGDLAGAFSYANRSLKLREALRDPVKVASCLNNLGIIYIRVGDYSQALECLKGAYDQLVECGEDPRRLTAIVNNIGIIYMRMGDYERAKASFKDGLELAEASGDANFAVAALVGLGDAHMRCNELDAAVRYLQQGFQACGTPELASTAATALLNLGQAYQRQGHLALAIKTLEQALNASDEPDAHAEALLAMSGAFTAANDAARATECAEQALALATTSGEKRLMSEAHERLAELSHAHEMVEQALHHYMEYHRLDRELFNEQSERRMKVLAVQFDVDRTRRQSEVYRTSMSLAQKARDAAEAEVRLRTTELEAAQIEVVTRLAMAAEYRDDDTGSHTWRVGRVAALLAEDLGFNAGQVDLYRLAARMHDVGKIGTPDAILLKPGKLSAPEYHAMESHATIGARILSGGRSRLLQLAEEMALTHHERWDGRGYPRGLRGASIPMSGRIVAVADVYDALTSRRPYKRAWPPEDALDELQRQSGKHFDPRVVGSALRVLTPENLERLEREAREEGEAAAPWRKVQSEGERATEVAQTVVESDPYSDPLTGLGNAAAFDLDLEAELVQAVRVRYPVHVLSVELRAEGRPDELEVILARALRQHLRGAGRTYRLSEGAYAAIVSRDADDDPANFEYSVQEAVQAVREAGWPAMAVQVGLATFPLDRKPSDGMEEAGAWSERFGAGRQTGVTTVGK